MGKVYKNNSGSRDFGNKSPWSSADFPWGSTYDDRGAPGDAYDYHFARRPAGDCDNPRKNWREVPGQGELLRDANPSDFGDRISGTKLLCCCKKGAINMSSFNHFRWWCCISPVFLLIICGCSSKDTRHSLVLRERLVLYANNRWIVNEEIYCSPSWHGSVLIKLNDALNYCAANSIDCIVIPSGDISTTIKDQVRKHKNATIYSGGRILKINSSKIAINKLDALLTVKDSLYESYFNDNNKTNHAQANQ